MEQTEYTTWEVVKMLRMLPFEELNSRFAQTLVKVIGEGPAKGEMLHIFFIKLLILNNIKELKECEAIRLRF